jgi:gamma-glutamyltranspeptidase/glutathione hydrolase
VAVPGVVAGLCALAQEMGDLPLNQILAPAIRLARDGVVLSEALGYVADILTPIFTDTPEIAAIYAPQGHIAKAGEKLFFPNLARTLTELGEQGPPLFYNGALAHQILADQRAHRGLLTEADLATYQVRKMAPIAVDYRGYTILLPPPASNGGVLIAFALKLLSTVTLAEMAHNGFEHLRLLIEVMRLTNVARAKWEDDFRTIQGGTLSEQMNCINQFLTSSNIAVYSQKLKDALTTSRFISEPNLPKGPGNTTHISVADANGMIVGITTSAGESAGFVVGDTGVTLNNMLGEIDLHPNGFHKLPPGQRLMTMMSPVLILRRDRPVLAVGSGGSNRLRTAIMQVISNFIDFRLTLDEAVDAPRIHFEDGVAQLEGGISSQVAAKLEATGYTVNCWPERNMFFGGAHAVAQDDNRWVAAGDRRRGGSTLVV